MKILLFIALVANALLLSGCQTRVDYQQPQPLSSKLSSADLQNFTNQMTANLLTSPAMKYVTQNGQPLLFVDTIRNQTSQIIDTQSLSADIAKQLTDSGQFRLVDEAKIEAAKQKLDYQSSTGLVNPSKAIRFGQAVGAQYMLYGYLSSTVKRNDAEKLIFYKMTMRLMDLQTGLVEWTNEKEFLKAK